MLKYQSLNLQVFERVPAEAINILDIGCGTGEMGKALLQQKANRKIYGITFSEKEAAEARRIYTEVYTHNLNDLSLKLNYEFDVIICSHVLEHTMFPSKILSHYLQYLKSEGIVIIALPNVLFFKQRWQFLMGRFRYNPNGGLMDSTHFHFFDFHTAKRLILNANLQMLSAKGFGAFPSPGIRQWFPSFSMHLDAFFCSLFPGLFSFQFVLVGKK